MKRVNIAEAKAGLSRLLRKVRAGESVTICDRNVPIAELRPVATAPRTERPLGLQEPGFEIPASFFEPLPPEVIRAFEGHDA